MPGKLEPPPRPKHDASYKSFFARRRPVADTLRASASDIAAHLDFATLERMPASFVTRALDQRHADMLWRVQTTGGRWLYILVLLEFQSTVDRRMALAGNAGPRRPTSAICSLRCPMNCLDTCPATGIFSLRSRLRIPRPCHRTTCSR